MDAWRSKGRIDPDNSVQELNEGNNSHCFHVDLIPYADGSIGATGSFRG
jgi:hypothetical protein